MREPGFPATGLYRCAGGAHERETTEGAGAFRPLNPSRKTSRASAPGNCLLLCNRARLQSCRHDANKQRASAPANLTPPPTTVISSERSESRNLRLPFTLQPSHKSGRPILRVLRVGKHHPHPATATPGPSVPNTPRTASTPLARTFPQPTHFKANFPRATLPTIPAPSRTMELSKENPMRPTHHQPAENRRLATDNSPEGVATAILCSTASHPTAARLKADGR